MASPAHQSWSPPTILYIWTSSPIISRSTKPQWGPGRSIAIRNKALWGWEIWAWQLLTAGSVETENCPNHEATKRWLESIAFEVHVPLLENDNALGFLESFRLGSFTDHLPFVGHFCMVRLHTLLRHQQHDTVDHGHGGQWQLSSMAVAWLRFFVQSAPPRGRRWTAFVEQHDMIRIRQGDQWLKRIKNSHEWCLLNGWAWLMSAKWFKMIQ